MKATLGIGRGLGCEHCFPCRAFELALECSAVVIIAINQHYRAVFALIDAPPVGSSRCGGTLSGLYLRS
ncbi:MAG: hypothetical protein R3E68_00110 [Burkholderiaceae bacterium]